MIPLILAALLPPAVTHEFTKPPATVEAYDVVQITGTDTGPAADRGKFPLYATFNRDGDTSAPPVYGFIDSADRSVQRVRFMPTKPGTYRYAVSYLRNEPARFEKVEEQSATGSFTVTASKRKGPLRIDPKYPHHFVWEGTGEHAFLNGTTAYWLLGVQDDERIKAAIDRLAAHKINRIRVALNARTTGGERWYEPQVKTTDAFHFRVDPWPNANPADPKKPIFDLSKFDLTLWRKLDRLVRHARDKDVLVSMVFHLDGPDDGVDPFGGGKAALKGYTGSDAEWSYYRYAAARLSGYSNVMWDITNEWHLFRSQEWVNKAGEVLKAADPYQHLTSVHGRGDYPFYKSGWSDFALYQSWDDGGAYSFMRKVRRLGDAVRPMPHINEEYGYEDHYPGPWGGGKKAPARAAANRAGLAWEMCFAGGYQTTGERADVPGQGGWITGLGDDSMKLPELHKHLADFFTSFEWWRCDPVDGLADNGARVLADADRTTVAVYLPQGRACMVTLPAGDYTATWFDPRTGKTTTAAAGGDWKADPPTAEPWAVRLVRK